MTVYSLISQLHEKKIKLWLEEGQLKFKAPKGAFSDEIRKQLVAHKKDLIAFFKQSSSINDVPPIIPVNREEFNKPPLSFSQERLWFINQLDPDSVSYNIPVASAIFGDVNVDHVEQALNRIIQRHDNLRTVFPSQEGQAYQLVHDRLEFKLDRIDLCELESNKKKHEKAKQICQSEALKSFDLAAGPLIRGVMIKLDKEEFVFMLSMHHIVGDGWSLGVLIKEFNFYMDAFSEGKDAELPPLPIQYVDYSVWQRKWLEDGGVLEQQLAYWEEKLSGVPECLDILTDYPRPNIQSFSGSVQKFSLDSQVTNDLKKLAEHHGCTLYMVLLAIFKVLLFRYTAQEDICIGSPIANRQYGETEGLIGMFVNTLALRTEVVFDDTFEAVLKKVKSTCLEAYENQDTPFEKIVDRVIPQRNIAVNPIYQIMVILQNAPVDMGDRLKPYSLENQTSNLDMIVDFSEKPDGLDGAIAYGTALYKPSTINQLVKHYISLCHQIVVKPNSSVSHFNFLDAEEKKQLLELSSIKSLDNQNDKCIHHLFIDQVKSFPAKKAVSYKNESLTYQELYDRSLDLALCLQSQGVKPDCLVGLCVDKSIDMVVGIFGILMAGGAYVPLDPTYPDDRLSYMLNDSKVAIVLTQGCLKDRVEGLSENRVQTVAIDEDIHELMNAVQGSGTSSQKLICDVSSKNLCYVIYTSGSTGQPKGVMIEHRNFHRLLSSTDQWFRFNSNDVFSMFHSFAFDFSVWEMFVGFSVGGTVVIVPEEVKKSNQVVDFLIEERVTVLNQTPSAFMMLSELVDEQQAKLLKQSLRVVIFGGEALNFRKLERWSNIVGLDKPVLVNMYGITETTVHVSYFKVDELNTDASVIGEQIPDLGVYVLDRNNQLQPVGVPGELHITGGGLARGYLNRTELTHQKFIDNPYIPGERMYKSGDLARWLGNGELEYLGRIDSQVKVRGFRVETNEIEAKLNQHRKIKNSAVIAGGKDDKRHLIAFYQTVQTNKEDNHIDSGVLKTFLASFLPEYMLPAKFANIKSIPLTSNGKIDRKKLEAISSNLNTGVEYKPPGTEAEEKLVRIWSDVLGLKSQNIGVNDNFFETGGNSLLAVKLIAKINLEFSRNLTIATLFTSPYISALAVLVSNKTSQALDVLVPIQTRGEKAPLFVMPGADGNVLSLQRLSTTLGRSQPFYGLQLVGLDGVTKPLDDVCKIAEENLSAIKSVKKQGPYHLLGYSSGGIVAFELARMLVEKGDKVDSLILLDTLAPKYMLQETVGSEFQMFYEGCLNIARLKYNVDLELDAEVLQQVHENERIKYVAEKLKSHNVVLDSTELEVTYRLMMAMHASIQSYVPMSMLKPVNVCLIKAQDENHNVPDDYGWGEFTIDPPSVYSVDGNHYSMIHEEYIGNIAKKIKQFSVLG